MRRIPEEKLFKGNIYKCVSSWSVAGSYFGIPYEEELVYEGKVFVQMKDGTYAELEDLKNQGRQAFRYKNVEKGSSVGEYFVKDLMPLIIESQKTL